MLSDRLCRLLTAFVDGELAEPQRQEVLRLLRESLDARSLLRELQQDAEQLRLLPRQTLDADFAHQLAEKIAGQRVPIRAARYAAALAIRSQVPPWLGLATAAAVLLMVGAASYLFFSLSTREEQAVPRGPFVKTTPELLPSPGPDTLAVAPGTAVGPRAALPDFESGPARATDRELVQGGTPPPELLPLPEPEESVYGSRVQKTEAFSEVDLRLALNLRVRELDQEKRKQQLLAELRKSPAYRLDLSCLEALPAVERLQAAFQAHGIRLLIDPTTQTTLKLRFKDSPSYAIYTENVTPDEVLAVVQYLRSEDRKVELRRSGLVQFDALVVNTMTADDHRQLSKLLGIDAAQLDDIKAKGPLGVDIHKPLSASTADEVAQALKGQGTQRPEPGKAIAKAPDRLAVLVSAQNGGHGRPSAEVKRFLASRKERASGTLQVLLLLRGKRG
jgi:hypothetical protein